MASYPLPSWPGAVPAISRWPGATGKATALIIIALIQICYELRPIGFGLGHEVARLRRELFVVTFVIDQIQLAVDDPPRLGIDVDGDPLGGNFAGAIAAELRRIFHRLALEQFLMLAAGEVPRRSQPVIG